MNKRFLREALELHRFHPAFYERPLPNTSWPIERCYVCGKMVGPLSQGIVVELLGTENLIFLNVCKDHRVEDLYDNRTGEPIIGEPKDIMQKIADDARAEVWYWIKVWFRYWWLPLKRVAWAVFHPVKFVKIRRNMMKWGMWEGI